MLFYVLTAAQVYALTALGGAIVLLGLCYQLRPGKSMKDKLVVITGAATGLGREMTFEFAKQGARLALWDINVEQLNKTLEEVVKETGVQAKAYPGDISQRELVYETAKKVQAEMGDVDCLINNAGILGGANLMDIPDGKIVKIFEVNVLCHFWTVKAFLPAMLKKNEGHIVSVASMAGLIGAPRMTEYSASKFAARGFMDALRAELKLSGSAVKTTCVCPGPMDTELFKGFKVPFIPAMSPNWMAQRIVKAVRWPEELVIEPFASRIGVLSWALTPVWLFDIFNSVSSGAMQSFDSTKASSIFDKMDRAKKAK